MRSPVRKPITDRYQAMIRHPIFVVGMPRSGTTLLSAMLDAHPQIAISPETHFFSLGEFDVEARNATDLQAALNFLLQQPGVQDMELTQEEIEAIRDRVHAADDARPPTVLWALLQTYASRFDVEAWGEKTPDHLRAVPSIAQYDPEAVFIAIVRDPRDVCLSLRNMPWDRGSLPEAAWTWRHYARLTEQYRETFPDRFYEVRYEDLLATPEEVLEGICAFLNAPFDPAMMAFHDEASPAVRAEPWKENTKRPVDPTNREKWRNEMGAAARWIVQRLTGKYLKNKGYVAPPVSFDTAFFRDLLRVLIQSVRVVATRIARRWKTPDRPPGDHRPVWVRQQGGHEDPSQEA